MNVRWRCLECETISTAPLVDGPDRVTCDQCGRERSIRPDAVRAAEGEVTRCPLCGTEDFYVQKNFPQRIGVVIVLAGIVGSSIYYYYLMPFWALGVLALTAVIDGVLYQVVPDVLTCYRCESQLTDCPTERSSRYRPFDLAIGERYRQERLRVEQFRKQRADSAASAK